jgi:hypothetical protein
VRGGKIVVYLEKLLGGWEFIYVDSRASLGVFLQGGRVDICLELTVGHLIRVWEQLYAPTTWGGR